MSNFEKYYIESNNKIYDNWAPKNANKLNGNIFSYAIRKMIQEILLEHKNYYVTYNNSFIKGCTVEWDLLIVKGEDPNKNIMNIYNPENIVCAIELKSGGYFNRIKLGDFMPNELKYQKALEKEITTLYNNYYLKLKNTQNINKNVKYVYISLYETTRHDKNKKIANSFNKINNNKLNNNSFIFIEEYNFPSKIYEKFNEYKNIVKTDYKFKQFIEEILK